jgi:hypothetical protein
MGLIRHSDGVTNEPEPGIQRVLALPLMGVVMRNGGPASRSSKSWTKGVLRCRRCCAPAPLGR